MARIMTCCFLGHREICETEDLKKRIYEIVEMLITEKAVYTFLFGSKSRFNSVCYEIVTQLKVKYPHIQRVYVRAEFPVIDDSYKEYLLENYEDTYYPDSILRAGRAVYIKRNKIMIDESEYCVFYCKEAWSKERKSGTKIALEYAMKHNKTIYRLPE